MEKAPRIPDVNRPETWIHMWFLFEQEINQAYDEEIAAATEALEKAQVEYNNKVKEAKAKKNQIILQKLNELSNYLPTRVEAQEEELESSNMDAKAVIEKLREYKVSLVNISKIAGVSKSTLSRYLKGKSVPESLSTIEGNLDALKEALNKEKQRLKDFESATSRK